MLEFKKKYIKDENGIHYEGVHDKKYKDGTRYIGQYRKDSLVK